jgi:hypothetical protein
MTTTFMMSESNFMDLERWFATLPDLGIDPHTAFPEESRLIERVRSLIMAQAEFKKRFTTDYTERAQLIASGDYDVEAAIEAATAAAHETSTDHHERVLQVLFRAQDFAQANAYRQFKHRRAGLLDAIRSEFDALSARIVAAATTIPMGVGDLEDAARLGHTDTYLQLERDFAGWGNLAGLVNEWTEAGLFGDEGRRRWPIEFMVDDVDAYREAHAGSSKLLRQAAGIAAGKPNLHIPTGTRPEPVDRAADTWRANRADETAREKLGLPK